MKTLTSTSLRAGILSFGLLVVPELAVAEAWRFNPEVSLSFGHNDNVSNDTDNKDSAVEREISATLGVGRHTEISSLDARVEVVSLAFDNDRDADDEDNQFLDVLGKYSPSERSDIALKIAYDREFTGISQEVDASENGLFDDDQLDPDVGLIDTKLRREKLRVSPSWQFNVNELTQIGLAYEYQDVSFDGDVAAAGLVDYDEKGLSASIQHSWRKKDTIFLTLQTANYEPDGLDSEIDTQLVTAGIRHNYSEKTFVEFQIGAREVNYDTAELDDDSGLVAKLVVSTQTELVKVFGGVERRISLSALGVAQESDILRLRAKRKLSERFNLQIKASYLEAEAVGTEEAGKRKEWVVEPALKYNLTEEFSIDVAYRFRERDRDADTGDFESNTGFLRINYIPLSEI